MKYYLNSVPFTCNESSISLKNIIESQKPFYIKGNSVCIIRKKESIVDENNSQEYKFITSKGVILIQLKGNNKSIEYFWKYYKKLTHIPLSINDINSIVFGPIKLDHCIPTLKEYNSSSKYTKYDIILINNNSNNSFFDILICKKNHHGFYGTKQNVNLGVIIGGHDNLLKFTKGDYIEKIEYIPSIESINEIYYITDLSFSIYNEDKIYTYSSINLLDTSPIGSELIYSIVKNNTFSIDTKNNSYCSNNSLLGEPCEYENFESRNRGYLTVRTYGIGRSRLYVYLKDRTSSLAHSVVGFISNGFELFKYSKVNSKISVQLNPPKIDLIGFQLDECVRILKQENIKYMLPFSNDNIDNIKHKIVVDHNPSTTLEILSKKEVLLTVVPQENIVTVEFYYDKAPKTIEFFKHSINLKTRKLGSLKLSMNYESTYIFNSPKNAEVYKELMPENIPKSIVYSGEIGITNQSAKRVGFIGIKLENNDFFGPTGEKFTATNIIGRILDFHKLKKMDLGDILYIQEKYRSDT